MNFNNFTIKSQEAVQKAVEITSANGQQAIEPVHLLKGVVDVGESLVNYIFQKLGVNVNLLKTAVDREIASLPKVSGGEPYLSREANAVLQKASDYSSKMGDQFVALELSLRHISFDFSRREGHSDYGKDKRGCRHRKSFLVFNFKIFDISYTSFFLSVDVCFQCTGGH